MPCTTTPPLPLHDGTSIPQLGFGVFQVPDDETTAAVGHALEAGYRSIDTAAVYGNERGVGRAIAASDLPREDLFVTTKLWVTDLEDPRAALAASLEKLGLDHVDLYLIHWPAPATDRYLEAWQVLEELRVEGLTRSIGVSNMLPEHLEKIVALGGAVPTVNQVELHPSFQQPDVQKADADHGVLTQAWSPIGGITFYPGWGDERRSVLQDPTIGEIAAAHDATPAQVMIRWHLQQGRSAIPKSVAASRIRENLEALQLELSAEELTRIDGLETGVRGGPDPDQPSDAYFDVVIPEA